MSCSVDIVGYSKLVIDKQTELTLAERDRAEFGTVPPRASPKAHSLGCRRATGWQFHEPSLIELFGIPIQGVAGVFDPVKKDIFEFPFITRSNPNLEPEDSRSFTAGIVYTPKFVTGLTLTTDLCDIESPGRTIIPDFKNVIDRSVTGNLLPGFLDSWFPDFLFLLALASLGVFGGYPVFASIRIIRVTYRAVA